MPAICRTTWPFGSPTTWRRSPCRYSPTRRSSPTPIWWRSSPGEARKQEAIASRDGVSEQVADALVTKGSEGAVATLMANASARIAAASLDTAIDRFADSERVKASMVHRANLPAAIAERLVVMVSDQLQSYLVRHHELPLSLATDMVLQSRDRATLHFSLGSSEQELDVWCARCTTTSA